MNTPLTKRRFLGSLGAVGLSGLTGCSAHAKIPPGKHLRLGTLFPAITLDPIEMRYVGSEQVVGAVFDGLFAYDDELTLVPRIAAAPPTVGNDGTRYEVALTANATFQNGARITPEDVKYSFEAPVSEDTAPRWRVDMLESVEVVDDRTVRFHLSYPYPAFEHSLTLPIVPKQVREDDRESFARDPVGSGPFEVRKFTEEKTAQTVRWDDYWGTPSPKVAAFTSAYVESPIVRSMSLKTGRNDVITPVSPLLWNRMKRTSGVSLAASRGFTSYYIGFNLNDGPTTKKPVREGMASCIDVDEVVSDLVEPAGKRQYSILPTRMADRWEMPLEEWRSMSARKNAERARRLFREADEASGQFRILTSKDPQWKEIAEALAGGLRDAGHGALVEAVSWKQYLERRLTGSARDYAVFVGGVSGHPDPDSFVYPTFHENNQGTTNGIFYNREPVMNDILAARRTRDEAERKRRYRSALTTLLEDRVYIPLCSFKNSFGVDRSVRHFSAHPIAAQNPQIANQNAVVTITDG